MNGIARRIGVYKEGLVRLGCTVDSVHPDIGTDKVLSHVNPWNFTSRMMIINPFHLLHLLNTSYDVVHVVMPANLSSMWVLAAFKVLRCLKREAKPALIVSWHCNIVDYMKHFAVGPLKFIGYFFFYLLFGMLPLISDRILTPTKKSEPHLVNMWKRSNGKLCAGVCFTGVSKTDFSPDAKHSNWGQTWATSKTNYLSKMGKKYLVVVSIFHLFSFGILTSETHTKLINIFHQCVGRLSPEKSVDELIKALPSLNDCALWLVGDGPHRPELERIARDLGVPVKFLGYQSGEALHSVYTVADLFVCPSLTETFGQTVNEARKSNLSLFYALDHIDWLDLTHSFSSFFLVASQVRVALPNVPVFAEAYGDALPRDAFWEPHNRLAMIDAIKKQLQRHSKNDPYGIPDLTLLKTWDEAVHALHEEYMEAFEDRQHTFTLLAALYFPLWWSITIATAATFFMFSQLRSLCGGSVRLFFRNAAEDVLIKVQSLQRLPSFEALQQMEKGQKRPVKQI